MSTTAISWPGGTRTRVPARWRKEVERVLITDEQIARRMNFRTRGPIFYLLQAPLPHVGVSHEPLPALPQELGPGEGRDRPRRVEHPCLDHRCKRSGLSATVDQQRLSISGGKAGG